MFAAVFQNHLVLQFLENPVQLVELRPEKFSTQRTLWLWFLKFRLEKPSALLVKPCLGKHGAFFGSVKHSTRRPLATSLPLGTTVEEEASQRKHISSNLGKLRKVSPLVGAQIDNMNTHAWPSGIAHFFFDYNCTRRLLGKKKHVSVNVIQRLPGQQ